MRIPVQSLTIEAMWLGGNCTIQGGQISAMGCSSAFQANNKENTKLRIMSPLCMWFWVFPHKRTDDERSVSISRRRMVALATATSKSLTLGLSSAQSRSVASEPSSQWYPLPSGFGRRPIQARSSLGKNKDSGGVKYRSLVCRCGSRT